MLDPRTSPISIRNGYIGEYFRIEKVCGLVGDCLIFLICSCKMMASFLHKGSRTYSMRLSARGSQTVQTE